MQRILKQQSHRVLPVTSIITFLGFLDTHLLIPVMALYATSLGASIGVVGLIIGLYSIINTPANIIFGQLIDRVGYKVPLITGLIGDVLSMVLYAFSRNPLHLALVRLLHGFSGALVAPSTMSIIANYSNREKKGRSMSYYGISLASASLIGYPVSGIIASRHGFNMLFFFGATVVGIGVLLSSILPGNNQKKVTSNRTTNSTSFRQMSNLLTRKSLIPSYVAILPSISRLAE